MKKKWVTLAIITFLYSLTAQASLLGFYGKFYGGYSGKDLYKVPDMDEVMARAALSYQGSPGWELELSHLFIGKGLLQNTLEGTCKTLLPLSNSLNLYGKLGFAWKEKLRAPVAGAGIRYNLSNDVILEASWTRTFILDNKLFNDAGYPPGHTDAIMLGVAYYLLG